MALIEFINEHDNWEELLVQPPYNLKIKNAGPYYILKYNQIESDFNEAIVREARGCIIRYFTGHNTWKYVCRAFDKFGNHGENYTAEIDWNTACAQEKVDGSLIKIWCDSRLWRISTNGTIYAVEAVYDDMGNNYHDLFINTITKEILHKIFANANKNATHMFELVSPETQLVVEYPEARVYYLGSRDNETGKEYREEYIANLVRTPATYPLQTLEDCLNFVQTMSKNEEGLVVCDANYNRMKIKSPEYLRAFHMENNGVVTFSRIIDMIRNNSIDDFMAYCPKHTSKVEWTIAMLDELKIELNLKDAFVNMNRTFYANSGKEFIKKELAELIKDMDQPYKAYCFKKFDNPELDPYDFIMSLSNDNIQKAILSFTEVKNK